jgi:hypothetical protein
MTPTAEILGHRITKFIHAEAGERLTGRAHAAANNAVRFLVKADSIADIAETVSYFCATHATEEAAACVIAAAKQYGYREEASKINPRDHLHKATVAAFAHMAQRVAQDARLAFSMHEPTKCLVLRAYPNAPEEPVYGKLSMPVFSFNADANNPDGTAAFERFVGLFSDEEAMVEHIKARANFRNEALYAQDKGVPTMTRRNLYVQLREHTRITMGLIWAAVDISYHDRREPFILQLLTAISSTCERVKKEKLCDRCGAAI